ncbi:MAG: PD-(D/E)XK nuclease family protein, partial [Cellulomonadaceae bacterium]|nr:PD-(D/E)XK nuclease family protein [Cellulomonadaceae bacterium]
AAELPHGTLPQLADLLEHRWPELGLSPGWVGAVQRRRADSMVRHLAAYLATSDEVLAVEQPFTVELGRVVLRGTVDRLERSTGGDLKVVDLKTGRTPASKKDAARHPQLGAYQAAVEAGAFEEIAPGARSGGASLVYVGTQNSTWSGRDQPALAADENPDWARDLVASVADAVSSAALAATANDLCRTCPVTRSCPMQPEGRVVGS